MEKANCLQQLRLARILICFPSLFLDGVSEEITSQKQVMKNVARWGGISLMLVMGVEKWYFCSGGGSILVILCVCLLCRCCLGVLTTPVLLCEQILLWCIVHQINLNFKWMSPCFVISIIKICYQLTKKHGLMADIPHKNGLKPENSVAVQSLC